MLTPVARVRRRRWRRLAPVGVVAVAGVANVVTGLFPATGLELAELTGSAPGSAPVLSGRVAGVELGAALLVLARWLTRGSRQAWRLAVLITAAAAAVGAVSGRVSVTVVVSALALVLLLVTDDAYRLRGRSLRSSRWWVPAAVAAGLVAFALLVYGELGESAPLPGGSRLAAVWRTLLFLPGGVDVEQRAVEAYVLALRLSLVVLVVAVVWAARARGRGDGGDRELVRDFARRHGTASTAPLLALPDSQLLALDGGRAWAAVGVRSGTAVCLGAPVAEPGREEAAMADLTVYCERNGWTPALLAADPAGNERALAAGYTSLQIGVEAVLDVETFSTAGKRCSNVRHSVSRARREEVTVVPYAGEERTAARTAQLAQVSSQWLTSKGGPELGFTLGRFDPDRLDDQEVHVAIHAVGTPAERVVAFVTWLPFDDGRQAVLDLMRRSQDCPPEVMELLIVDSLAHFQALGRTSASLGGVPLASDPAADEDEAGGRARRTLGWVYENGGEVYDARGLFRFKEKFAPRWEPMWLAYPGRGDLPRITLAAVRAFLPPGAVREALRTRRAAAAATATG